MSGRSRLERLASFFVSSSRSNLDEVEQHEPPHTEPQPDENSSVSSSHQHPSPDVFASCLIRGQVASCNAWKWHVGQADKSLLQLERLHTIMARLNASPSTCFNLFLPRAKLASSVLDHCASVINSLAAIQGGRYKIGITMDPYNRWFNDEYGYGRGSAYASMHIITIARSMETAAFIEAALLREFRLTSEQCDNLACGGEGVDLQGELAFVYVVQSQSLKRKRQI